MATETVKRIYELQVKLAQESLAQLKKVEDAADAVEKRMGKVAESAKRAGAALVAAFSVHMFVDMVERSIEAAAALDDMSERTGAAVEKLSELKQVAFISGTSIEVVEKFLVKLNKALNATDEEGQKGANALAAVGLKISDLKKLDPADAMRKVALAFNEFADSGAKTAAIMALTGKSAQEALPYMRDLATEQGISAKVTKEQAAQAEELQKQWRRLQNDQKQASESLARDLIPALSRVTLAMHQAYKEGGTLMALWIGLGAAAANALGLDEAQQRVKRLKEVTDQLAVARKQLESGTLNPKGANDKFFAFMIPDTILSEQSIELLRQRVDDIETEKVRLEAIINPPPEKATGDKKLIFDPDAIEKAKKALEELKKNRALTLKAWVDMIEHAREVELAYGQALNDGKSGTAEAIALEKERIKTIAELTGETGLKLLTQQVKWLDDAYQEGTLTFEKYQAGLDKVFKVTRNATAPTDLQKMLETLADKIDGYAKSVSSSLIDMIGGTKDAKLSFSEFANSVIRDMAKMATQILLIEPLMASFKTALTSIGTQTKAGTPFWEAVVKAFGASSGAPAASTGGGSYYGGAAKGDVFTSPQLSAYSGGVYHSPRTFEFAKGAGVFAEAGPEAIMPLKRGADGALGVDATGAGVVVNVYNEARADVQTKSRKDLNGNRIIEVMVRDAVSNGFKSGAFDSVLGATYGLNRMGAR